MAPKDEISEAKTLTTTSVYTPPEVKAKTPVPRMRCAAGWNLGGTWVEPGWNLGGTVEVKIFEDL